MMKGRANRLWFEAAVAEDIGRLPWVVISEPSPIFRSRQPSRRITGPIVMSRKSSEGGYFVQLTNEKQVKRKLFWPDHGCGSPYKFTANHDESRAQCRSQPEQLLPALSRL